MRSVLAPAAELVPRAEMATLYSSFHGGSCSHRLKRLFKSNRRVKTLKGRVADFRSFRKEVRVFGYITRCLVRKFIFLRVPVGESKSHLKLWMAMSATVEEIAGVASGAIVCHFEGLNVDKVENALGQILHIEDNVEKEKTICCAEKVTTSTKLGTEISVTNLKCHRSLDKSATFSSPSRVPLVETARKNAITAADRSLSFPCSFKLVSAMKVSREAEGGTTPKTKMNVSWAPGVYDPPVTSVSHSVKSYNQRSYLNNKKKDRPHKHKNRKGKGTRDGNNEKKHQQRQSDPSRTRSLTPTFSGEFPSGGFGESEALVAEGSVGGSSQDMKCGDSCFLRASLGSVVYTVAEV